MTLPDITIASSNDRERVIQTIALGFSADPVCRWIWPHANLYLEAMPKFVAAFAGKAFEHGSAYHAEDCKAAALWLPPGVEPDGDAIGVLFETTVMPEISVDLESVFVQMDEYHPTDRPCWYLPLIAADPNYLSQGLGAAIMKHALRRCDEDGLNAYLESSNPRNISLYERHGFEVIGKIQAGSSPTMYPMIREARPLSEQAYH